MSDTKENLKQSNFGVKMDYHKIEQVKEFKHTLVVIVIFDDKLNQKLHIFVCLRILDLVGKKT